MRAFCSRQGQARTQECTQRGTPAAMAWTTHMELDMSLCTPSLHFSQASPFPDFLWSKCNCLSSNLCDIDKICFSFACLLANLRCLRPSRFTWRCSQSYVRVMQGCHPFIRCCHILLRLAQILVRMQGTRCSACWRRLRGTRRRGWSRAWPTSAPRCAASCMTIMRKSSAAAPTPPTLCRCPAKPHVLTVGGYRELTTLSILAPSWDFSHLMHSSVLGCRTVDRLSELLRGTSAQSQHAAHGGRAVLSVESA